MAVSFHIPGPLRTFTHGRSTVQLESSPATAGEALLALCGAHPGVRDRIVDERGDLREHVNVFVGSECIRFTGGLGTPIRDGDEITIVPAVSGG